MTRRTSILAVLVVFTSVPIATAAVTYDFDGGIGGFEPTPADSWNGGPGADALAVHLPIIGSDNVIEIGVVSTMPIIFADDTPPAISFELSVTDDFVEMIDISDLFFAELVLGDDLVSLYSLCGFGCDNSTDDFPDDGAVLIDTDPSGEIDAGDVYNIRFRYRHEARNLSIEVGLFRIDNLVIEGAVVLGDTNGDNLVNLDDLNNVRNHFGQSGPPIPGDTNFDGVVSIDDLNNVRNHFGAPAAAVPEPASVVLAVGVVFTVLITSRRGTFTVRRNRPNPRVLVGPLLRATRA